MKKEYLTKIYFKMILVHKFRGVTVGGQRGAIAPPPFSRKEGAAGSGGALS